LDFRKAFYIYNSSNITPEVKDEIAKISLVWIETEQTLNFLLSTRYK
jgi:hypothetical protein